MNLEQNILFQQSNDINIKREIDEQQFKSNATYENEEKGMKNRMNLQMVGISDINKKMNKVSKQESVNTDNHDDFIHQIEDIQNQVFYKDKNQAQQNKQQKMVAGEVDRLINILGVMNIPPDHNDDMKKVIELVDQIKQSQNCEYYIEFKSDG